MNSRARFRTKAGGQSERQHKGRAKKLGCSGGVNQPGCYETEHDMNDNQNKIKEGKDEDDSMETFDCPAVLAIVPVCSVLRVRDPVGLGGLEHERRNHRLPAATI
jgi:hypothetical protein